MIIGEISCRTKPQGGDIQSVSPPPAASDPNGRQAVIVLIHGYNSPQPSAKKAFETFIDALTETAGRDIPLLTLEFFWPGDLYIRSFSALSFPYQVTHVRNSANELGDYLSTLQGPSGGPIDIHFVAHSLGNRLLLEMLSSLKGGRLVVRSVTYMAAAVPVEMVFFNKGLYQSTRVPIYQQALHSTGDDVLHWAFPPGETACFEGFWPTAIGRAGDPIPTWNSHAAFDDFGHSDYWIKPGPPEAVLRQLGYASARTTPSSSIPSRSIADRDLGA
ncbi:MAG: hypothetical protein NVS9B15_03770 [Acidobacteriaceae bacterium]